MRRTASLHSRSRITRRSLFAALASVLALAAFHCTSTVTAQADDAKPATIAIAEIKHILKNSGDQFAQKNATSTYQQVESGSMEMEVAGHDDVDHGHTHH
jgi:hypothetical protein